MNRALRVGRIAPIVVAILNRLAAANLGEHFRVVGTHSPQFSAVIVATNGAMARMNTLDPIAFVRFKHWMSGLPRRDPLKRRRDALQATSLEAVVREYLLQQVKD